MLHFKRTLAVLVGLWLILGSLGLLWAQSDRATITGTVTDQTGAVIVGAAVTATNVATGISIRATTSSAGDYEVPLLPAGSYQLTVEQTGLKKSVQSGIDLEVGQTVRVDVKMQVGQATQTVQVTAQAELLQRDTSDRGTVVTARDVEELPIVAQQEQRNAGFYMTLAPGVTGRGTATPTASGSGRELNTTVNGSPSGSTEFHLDGAVLGNGYMLAGDFRDLPFPPDAVGEFNVMTLNPPAQYGQTGLGITSFSIKSGTNRLHGDAYEYFRNDALDTRGFFSPTVPVLKQNEFGITAGGPVYIPKVYDGRDKTFFFGWYDGFRLKQQATNSLDTVPTASMRAGDFSNVLGGQIGTDALGRPVYSSEIYDPSTQRTVAPGGVDPMTGLVNKSGASAILRNGLGFNNITGLPIAGQANVIPSGRIDPVAAKIFSYFPNPNPCPTCAFGYKLNWLSSYLNQATINQQGAKVDHVLSDRNRIMGEFIWSHNLAPTGSKWPGAISEGANSTIQQDVARFSDDYSLRPDLINHWVVGFNRLRNDSYPQAGTGWPAKLGYSGVPQTGPGSTFIEMDIGGLGNTYARAGQSFTANNNWTFDDNLSWIKGRHSIKMGFSYVRLGDNALSTDYQSSYLTFNAGTTSLPGTWYNDSCAPGGTCPGMGAAGFLLGQVSHGLEGIVASEIADRMGRYAGYVQDNFKASPRLTLNLGLRYDLILPTVSAHNDFSWMDPTVVNPAIGIRGAEVFATPGERSPVHTDTKAFGPRLGLAYAINDKTILRSGYGILYTAGGGERSIGNSYEQQGFSVSNSVNEDSSTGYTGLLAGTVPGNPNYHMTLANGWPASLLPVPPFISPSTDIGEGPPAFGSFPGDGNLPYIQTWDLDLQREIPGHILLDAAYVGTKGTHLPSRLMNTNATPTTALQYGPLLFSKISDPSVQALAVVQGMPVDPTTGLHAPFKGFQTLWGGSATLGQALRPYPQYTSDTVEGLSQLRDFGEDVGSSSYNALQIQARKHFSQGLSFLVSYTWSKTLTDAGSIFNEFSGFTQDFYNVKPEKALSLNDYPNNLVISYEYQLPFGPGKKFGNVGGLAGRTIGGWSIAGVQQYQSGAPQEVVTGDNALTPYMGPNSFLMRPNIVPGVPKKSIAILTGKWNPNGGPVHFDGSPCTKTAPCTTSNAYDSGAVLNVAAWCDPQKSPTSGGCTGGPFTFNQVGGTAPPTDGSIRRFPYYNEDISILKRTSINERVGVEFRADFLNIFNRTLFGFDQGGDQYGSVLQGNNLGSGLGGFGHITSQSNFPREIQFGLKLTY
ncbi:MAG TPA: TonB-dependent receptor [Terriglobia bacterium]|nr:TonB-dependent receptor [Terriglobia bacterium]